MSDLTQSEADTQAHPESQAVIPSKAPSISTKTWTGAVVASVLVVMLGLGGYVIVAQKRTRDAQTLRQSLPSEMSQQNQSPPQTGTNPAQTFSEVAALQDLPPLYPPTGWTLVPPGEPTLGDYAIDYYSVDSGQGTLSVPGQQWIWQQRGPSDTIVTNFTAYYQSEFQKRGWTEKVTVNGKRLMVTTAGGPDGSSGGFMKVENDSFRVLQFGSWQQPDGVTLRVFISDVVPLSQ